MTKDEATNRYNALRDALKLAEQSAPYIDGEQWAVSAVMQLRREIVEAVAKFPRAEPQDFTRWRGAFRPWNQDDETW